MDAGSWQNFSVTKKPSTSENSKQAAREKRLKEALRANLQRRRHKAHAHRLDADEETNLVDKHGTAKDGRD